ncbi:helix-turn-helix domain-containing protein [Clostridium botulinum]|uniref:Helix-turn-helix transcriptional regulator n=1 Tax=Clostridium botulinum TaxID=1491 RepID=A0A6B4JJY4_CLOBO|nr:helix-turn-helix domain-containing protein [Clostridium botulinum]EES48578.1 transcriptional regulator, Cro/CI family [Clostridium botulinum E1 str. 'BoNT E Beluga']MBY6760123.1 helix-turn-helix domain-containing protein [Clostridium botulinum]MBY6919032.1 helix-turn-helix domain-containing protein [Clostridium botulinum]MCR1132245.1 helix-turn-helix domain-containing protein [Clostridium botulinum]NFJ57324.1 helix-turn-helix transcriptional regulator [Clostridium botulinum]
MEIKDIIRKRREELDLTYEQLGKIVGVGKSTVRKWETGIIGNLRSDSILALAKGLNLSPSTLMGWTEEENTYDFNLTKEETNLLEHYNKLNDLGKKEANKRVAELTEINKYRNNTLSHKEISEEKTEYNFAAHDDNLDYETSRKNIEKAKEIFRKMDEEK